MNDLYYQYWGKASKDKGGERYHLLIYHSLDVAAVGSVWLEQDRALRSRIFEALGGNVEINELLRLISFFLALHDFGKFDIRFQTKVPEVYKKVCSEVNLRDVSYLSQSDITSYDHRDGVDILMKTGVESHINPSFFLTLN